MAEVTPGEVAPVVNAPVAAEVATPEPSSTAEPAGEAPEGAEPKAPEPEKMLTQSEVNKLIQKRERLAESRASKVARAEAERDFYKQQLEERARPSPTEKASGRPQMKDYADPEQWMDAVEAWRESRTKETTQRETQAQQQERMAYERRQFATEKIVKPGRAKYADYDDVVLAEDAPITELMVLAAGRLKNGVDVLYHLGQNREEAYRISQMPDIEAAWEIKALESKLSQPAVATKTPPPIKPLDGNAGAKRDWADLSTAEHVDKWLKRKR